MCGIVYLKNDPCLSPEALIQLYSLIGWNASGARTTERVARILSASACYVSASINGELVGFGRLMADGSFGQILDLMTHPDHRGRGIATQIMKRLLEEAAKELLGLHVIDGSGGRGHFYERFGFSAANPETDLLMYLTPRADGVGQDDAHGE